MSARKQEVELFSETLRLSFTDQGEGRPFLLLHGGAGPASMSGLGGVLSKNARALIPTHPGFNGQPRPDSFARIDDLVLAYLALIERLDLKNVVVVGNSVGGWIAAELALRKSPRIVGIVLLNAVGIDTGDTGSSIVDPMKLEPAERAAMSFHAPDRFAIVPSGPEAAAAMANNQRTLRVYAGEPFMHEPTLRSRLAQISVPALIAWGESDRIVDVNYGRLYASSIPGARFELISEAAHFPQIERLDEVVRLIGDFTSGL
jgi:pimeloyl-ACP methyl ester carboxylesterase